MDDKGYWELFYRTGLPEAYLCCRVHAEEETAGKKAKNKERNSGKSLLRSK